MSMETEGGSEPPQVEEQPQGELSYAVLDYSINWSDFCEKHGIGSTGFAGPSKYSNVMPPCHSHD